MKLGKIGKTVETIATRRLNTIKMIIRPSNLPRLVGLIIVLGALYYVYSTYLKEGMTSKEKFESTPETFDKDIAKGKKLVMFYAGWCGHCTKLKPTWDAAAKKLNKGEDSGTYQMWKINVGGDESPSDATPEQEAVAQKYSVKGYPTIYVFENGKMVTEYEGPRTEAGFMKILS